MNPILFFNRKQVIRKKDFFFTYAGGQDLKNSVAYANDYNSLKFINKKSDISTIITKPELIEKVVNTKGAIVSENPQKNFYQLHNFMVKENHISALNGNTIDKTAVISSTAKIGNNAIIGKNVIIKDYVIIESNTIIGDDTEIESFAVIGAKSMQKTIVDNRLFHLEYAGGVRIGDRTKVLTGAVIQKPYQAFYTTVGNDSVISTKVVIGHGCKIGNRTMFSGGSGIAGNCVVGDDVWIGGGAMVSDGIRIENKAQVLMGSVVVKDVGSKEIVSGNFAFDHKKNMRHQIKYRQ